MDRSGNPADTGNHRMRNRWRAQALGLPPRPFWGEGRQRYGKAIVKLTGTAVIWSRRRRIGTLRRMSPANGFWIGLRTGTRRQACSNFSLPAPRRCLSASGALLGATLCGPPQWYCRRCGYPGNVGCWLADGVASTPPVLLTRCDSWSPCLMTGCSRTSQPSFITAVRAARPKDCGLGNQRRFARSLATNPSGEGGCSSWVWGPYPSSETPYRVGIGRCDPCGRRGRGYASSRCGARGKDPV